MTVRRTSLTPKRIIALRIRHIALVIIFEPQQLFLRGRNGNNGLLFESHYLFPLSQRLVLENGAFLLLVGENVDAVSIGVIKSVDPVKYLHGHVTTEKSPQLSVRIPREWFGH